MSGTVGNSNDGLISEGDNSLISDLEWRALVSLHAELEQRQNWYSEGYRDGKSDALHDAAEMIATTGNIMPNDETRQVVISLAAILSFMVSTEVPENL